MVKVRLEVPPPPLMEIAPLVMLDPAPSAVTVPVPAAPMIIVAAPDERLPPARTLVAIPPASCSVPVVENVEPAPVMMIFVELPKRVRAPVTITSPPFWTVSVLKLAMLRTPVASRVSCAPSSVRFSLMAKVPVPDTATVLVLLSVFAVPVATSVVVPAVRLKSAPMAVAVALMLNAPAPLFVIVPVPVIGPVDELQEG